MYAQRTPTAIRVVILALLLGNATVAMARPQPIPPPGPAAVAGKGARRPISRFQLWRAGIAAEREARRQRRRQTKPSFKQRLTSLIAGGVALSIFAAPPVGIAGPKAAPQTIQPTPHEHRLAAQPSALKDGVVTVQTADGPRQYRVLPAEKGQVDLVGAMRGALVKLAKKGVYREHRITIHELELGDHAGIGFRIKARPVAKDDALITGNAYRAALTKKMKDAGKPVAWVEVGGGILPQGAFTVPLSGGYVGFSADAMVGYSVLAPYQHELKAIPEAGKNVTADLPVTWKKAQALKDGTVVRLVGRARYVVHGGVGGGETLAIGKLATISTYAGVHASRVKEGNVELEIQKRGDQVYVRVTEIGTTKYNGWAGKHIGIDSHLAKDLPSSENRVGKWALDQVYKQVDNTLEKYLKAGFRVAEESKGTGDKVIAAYSFTGQGRDVARAYEKLIRFSPDRADKMISTAGSGVARASLVEATHTTSSGPSAYVGPWKIISEISSSTLRHGTVESSQGSLTYDRAKLADGSTGILPAWWKGKREVTREYVTVKYPGQEARQTYLRVQHTVKKDRFTTKDEVRRFKNLAEFLGAAPQGKDYRAKKLGKTDRVVDVYITDAGLKRLAATKPAELLKAYSEAYKKIDRPWDRDFLIGGNKHVWRENPWMVKDHPRYNEIIWLLELGPEKKANSPHHSKTWTREDTYNSITRGRKLAQDSAAYKQGKMLVKLVERLRAAGSPAERARVFAQADRELSLDFWKELATLSIVAGPDNVLVNQMAIHGKKQRSITYRHEGAIRDPQSVVDARLEHP